MLYGVERCVDLPGRTSKESVDRGQRQDVEQGKIFDPGMIASAIVPQSQPQRLDLRAGRIAGFRIEQIVKSQAKIRLVEKLALTPADAQPRSHGLVPLIGRTANRHDLGRNRPDLDLAASEQYALVARFE